MPDTPLSPDALAHARSAAFGCWENGGNMDDLAECAIEAYLAVAQPVVNSVEELDKLPVGTVLRDRIGWIWEIQDVGEFITTGSEYDSYSQEVNLPARVLYRPTRESTNGR